MRTRSIAAALLTVAAIFLGSLATNGRSEASQAGLISWWPAEGNALDIVSGYHGEARNTAYARGQIGLAFFFDGSVNTGVIIGDVPALESMPALTVEAWVCTTDPKGDRAIISKHYSHENNTPSYILRTTWTNNLGTVGFGVDTTGGRTITDFELNSTTSIADGRFHHLAGTYDGSFVRLYVDGILEAMRPLTGTVRNSTNEVVIGNAGSGNHPTKAPETSPSFAGRVDEARIYDRAISLGEILGTIAAAGAPVSCLPAVTVVIDIKPGSYPNSVNPRNRGVVPVAILSSADLDALEVDPTSVRFGSGGAAPAHGVGHIEDVNDDGIPDRVFHFPTRAIGLECDTTQVTLTGETFDGQPIEGVDSVRIVGCG